MSSWSPLVILFAANTAWFLRYTRRGLQPSYVILTKLYPHETDSIENFAPREGFDFLKDDKGFWAISKGWKGLKRKRHNAVCLVHFCQSLTLNITDIEEEEMRLMTVRAILVTFYTGCSLLECPVRFFIKDFPHSCARTATNLYWEMERRATTLCSVYRPELIDQLHQIL